MSKNNIDANITLKEYFNTKLESIEKAIVVAKDLMNIRLDSMNHLRDIIKSQVELSVTRAEFNTVR